jgi:hypothetical protein
MVTHPVCGALVGTDFSVCGGAGICLAMGEPGWETSIVGLVI